MNSFFTRYGKYGEFEFPKYTGIHNSIAKEGGNVQIQSTMGKGTNVSLVINHWKCTII
jgi:hypothetical protein